MFMVKGCNRARDSFSDSFSDSLSDSFTQTAGLFKLSGSAVWKLSNKTLPLCRPYVMGILNVTPDSFSDGGLHNSFDAAIAFADQMISEGADIIDVGGESTRPGSLEVSIKEELDRVLPVVEELSGRGLIVSIDTRHPEVAARCVEAGAAIINDVSGFRDSKMIELAAACDAGLVAMHMLGTPRNMQQDPHYADVVDDVSAYLINVVNKLKDAGVDPRRICIDPGPGFGKDSWHNMALLAHMGDFSNLELPLIAAFSRKATLGKVCSIDSATDRLIPSATAAVLAFCGGVRIFRVHDVAETVQALQLASNAAYAAFSRANSSSVASPASMMPGKRALVALGANMGNPQDNLIAALKHIDSLPRTSVIASSPIYKTAPAYYDDQDDFANSAAWIQTELEPLDLLEHLLEIENVFHRKRLIANGPRTLDLDLLDYEGQVISSERLTIPHPRILERDFAVTPILDLAEMMRSVFGKYVHRELLEGPDAMRTSNECSYMLADGTFVGRDGIKYGMIEGRLVESCDAWR